MRAQFTVVAAAALTFGASGCYMDGYEDEWSVAQFPVLTEEYCQSIAGEEFDQIDFDGEDRCVGKSCEDMAGEWNPHSPHDPEKEGCFGFDSDIEECGSDNCNRLKMDDWSPGCNKLYMECSAQEGTHKDGICFTPNSHPGDVRPFDESNPPVTVAELCWYYNNSDSSWPPACDCDNET